MPSEDPASGSSDKAAPPCIYLFKVNTSIYLLSIPLTNFSFAKQFIIVGDTEVGKSSLLLRFISNKYTEKHELTIGMEFGSVRKPLTLLGETGEDVDAEAKIQVLYVLSYGPEKEQRVRTPITRTHTLIQIWDTAGTESFLAVTRSYYIGAHAGFLQRLSKIACHIISPCLRLGKQTHCKPPNSHCKTNSQKPKALVVFDVCKRSSFDNLKMWLKVLGPSTQSPFLPSSHACVVS
jgi:GTPase SAR1 family protein